MSKSYFLGIDTSNYTTSLAVIDANGQISADSRQLLPVEAGEKGLRQSEALFWHIKNLPDVVQRLTMQVPDLHSHLRAIAVTTSPRPVLDSYMPVFLAGTSFAEGLASILQVPCFSLSHQENHLWAGLFTAGRPKLNEFLALHLSGGTTELLHVRMTGDYHLQVAIIGGSMDLHAGQFIDRVGVAIGLPFPAGPHLERLASSSQQDLVIPSYHREGQISFAGQETAALRLLQQHNKADVARAVLMNIARTIAKMIRWAAQKTGITKVVLVGGVCANQLIRAELTARLDQLQLYFADPRFSVDNALGAAIFAGLSYGQTAFYSHVFP